MVSGARAVARCDLLGVAPYSDVPDGLFRGYLTPAYARTQEAIGGWMADAGMIVSRDPAANLIGRYEGADPEAPALIIGSHIDSVRDAGRYDGPLGVMLGIECAAALSAAGRRLPFAIEVVGFGDEEGSRFPAAMLTSRAVAGTLAPETLAVADPVGVTLAEALADHGFDIAAFPRAVRPAGSVLAYLEAHIEQGPVLDAEGLALGVVSGIAAQRRLGMTIEGLAGHAGTCSMALRRDALAGAAEAILAVERIARLGGTDLVATVGRIAVLPGAANVVPGEASFTVDVRSGYQTIRDEAAGAILREVAAICDRRGLHLTFEILQDLPASPCDPELTAKLAEALVAAGHPARTLVSGAGHDAMVMAALCPTAMLFIRCEGGISHNPAERVTAEDAQAALEVMLGFIDRLEAEHRG